MARHIGRRCGKGASICKTEAGKKEKKYGITYEEYEQLIDVNAEDAAYKTYSYEGILTNGVPFVTAGYFPTNYGIDYIISDDSVQYIAKSIMNTGKECYLYIEDDGIIGRGSVKAGSVYNRR